MDVSKVPFEQTHASQRIAALFDNLVSSAEQRWWHDEIERLGGAAVALSKVQSVDQRMRLESVSAFANTGHAVTFVRRYLTGMTIGWPFSAMRKSIACARSVVLGFLMR